MACCWGPGDPAATLVMLDSCGEILDVLCTGPLSWESLTWTIPFFDEATQLHMNCDQERILKFVTDHQPDVAIIGAANMSCPLLREQLLWVSDTVMMKPNSRASPLRIVSGDESLARLYENSEISSEQLPGRSGIARRAVALGRYLQNPLAMVATLCGAGREILSWKLLNSPDENYLNPDEKYAVIEQVMIDATNQVGLDINLAINHEWLFAPLQLPLQFISGLGPQMAASLKKSLVKSGKVSTRNEFATLHGMGARVYVNAVGFLRVRLSGMLTASSISSQFFSLLDDTRIHPDLYCFAEQMAQDVCGDMVVLVQSIRDLPSYLKKLDIEAYTRSKGLHYMMQTLCCIREELIQGFQKWRKKYEELSDDDMFYMMTGETRDTLLEGSIVQATIRRVLSKTAICTVGAGLICLLWRDDFKVDGREISDLSQVMKVPEKMIPLRVVYGDETLACLYENSQISADQLPGQSGMVRRAVALGRYLQNPLAMVATLCGPGRDILSWKPLTSPFDNFLTPDEKYATIEQVMVDVTNQVGLDITLATSHEWLFAPLQFISGLGPRKAASLQQSSVRSGEILARRELATLHGLGRRVYLNAVGFLRIRQHGLAASSTSSQFNAMLDDTRIHPESYLLAQEMAKDVYDDKDAMELQRIRDQPSYLEKLEVEAYAKSKKLESKMQTLCGKRRELIQGFQDERKTYEELDEDDMFYTMTGETCNTLSQGSIVQAIVRRALPKTTICTVGAGLICTLKREDFTVNGREISDLSLVLKVGDIITCKIKRLRTKRLNEELCSL